ncbi:FecR family protein [Formosa sp. 4Alg 33]|uniref:FecR family protein n=1 Tax=Formosa sp. 4Alg 33 TaxID=3382189 RepID=UPI003D9C41B4
MKNRNTNFFQDLLDRYLNDTSTIAENTVLDNFFDSKSKTLDWDSNTLGNKELLKARLKSDINYKINPQSKINRKYFTISIAASILLIIGLFTFLDFSPKQHVFATTQTLDSLLLKDGSKIILGPNSILEYPSDFNDNYRAVELKKGNAFFKIKRDTTKPFQVNHPKLSTQVLGTSFTINITTETIAVHVMTGKVSVKSENNLSEILNPTDRATFNFTSNNLLKDTHFNSVSWYDKEIKIKNRKLIELAQIIKSRFGYRVSFENDTLKEKLVTLTIDTHTTMQSLINQLEYITNVKFKIKDYEIEITE